MANAAGESQIGIGRVIGRGAGALGGSFLPFTGFALLFAGLPAFVAELWLYDSIEAGDAGLILSAEFWLSVLGSMIAAAFVQAILVRSSILRLSGRSADVGPSVVLALRLLPQILGIALLTSLMIGLGLLALVVPGVILYLMFIVAVPALVEERAGVIGSLRRSSHLTGGSKGHIFWLVVVYSVFSWLLAFALGAITVPLGDGLGVDPAWGSAATQALFATIIALASAALASALYVELREVKEGATLDSLAEVFA